MSVYGILCQYAYSNLSQLRRYAGNISFTINNRLQIIIPNHQLVIPRRTINDQGVTVLNDSIREVMVANQSSQEPMAIFGFPFLSSAYLMVNYDEHAFTLWQANPTTEEKLVALGFPSSCQPSRASTESSSTLTSVPWVDSSSYDESSTHISAGGIAGTVIGGLLGLGIIAGAIWVLIRRKKTKQQGKLSYEQEMYMKAELPVDVEAKFVQGDLNGHR